VIIAGLSSSELGVLGGAVTVAGGVITTIIAGLFKRMDKLEDLNREQSSKMLDTVIPAVNNMATTSQASWAALTKLSDSVGQVLTGMAVQEAIAKERELNRPPTQNPSPPQAAP
jgi:hypothetical protein